MKMAKVTFKTHDSRGRCNGSIPFATITMDILDEDTKAVAKLHSVIDGKPYIYYDIKKNRVMFHDPTGHYKDEWPDRFVGVEIIDI